MIRGKMIRERRMRKKKAREIGVGVEGRMGDYDKQQ